MVKNRSLSDFEPEPDLRRASTLPARWYCDPTLLELEQEKVFAATWQAVGHTADVAQPGDYFSCECAGEPLIVARGLDGKLRAFSNVCRHRAALLAEGKGHATVLRCPYHGWTYQLDGSLHSAPEFEGVLDWRREEVLLPQAQVETWGPFVFVRLSPTGPSLLEYLGDIPQRIREFGCQLESLRFHARKDYFLDCNWKVYVDNYLEGYHVPAAHPGLFRELDYKQYQVETFRYYSKHHAPLRPAASDEQNRRYGQASQSGALYYWLFPNFMLNIYPDNLSSNIILPLGHRRTLTVFEWFFPAEQLTSQSDVVHRTLNFSEEIQQEDIRLCESVQRGLESRSYHQGRFSAARENGVHHFHLLLHEFLTR
ncbi:MAG: Rieske 2Fe-2S domain-containing protein [Bryobacteraceae bacterium]|nr:Rieske 2Fe-2S domain-containing protein [Bryobacteraceae bacterium]MDW8376952.1 SRPBCC family protein [Bryobacterales bacterium]